MDKNQFVAEKLGLCWHGISDYEERIEDGGKYITLVPKCIKCGLCPAEAPDFSTDSGAVELLRLMMGRPSWWEFISEAWGARRDTFEDCFKIITTPGALLDAAAEWFGWEEEE